MDSLDDIRSTLAYWGRFWRMQEMRGMGYAPNGPGQKLIELARLGCRIQSSMRPGNSEAIHVPPHIRQIDAAVENLPGGQKAALVMFYIRNPRMPRRRVKSRALLRAEIRIGQEI